VFIFSIRFATVFGKWKDGERSKMVIGGSEKLSRKIEDGGSEGRGSIQKRGQGISGGGAGLGPQLSLTQKCTVPCTQRKRGGISRGTFPHFHYLNFCENN